MDVINYVIYHENPYHQLLYSAILDEYRPIRGDVDAAIQQIGTGEGNLFHVHWEEHAIRRSPTAAEAKINAKYFLDRLAQFKSLGGRCVWTLHNAQPHELQNADAFWMLRRGLAELADRILIHNVESGRLLSEQAPVAASKLFYLPHPAYLGVYKAADLGTADPTNHIKSDRVVLLFGMVRRYKAVERTLDWLTPDFTSRNGLRILVAGEALQGDAYADQLQAEYGQRTDVQLDLRRIPDSEVAPLFSSVSCLVLGYSRFLTSGAALLGLSLEVPIVAPRVPQMTELLPTEVHRFLYTPEDADDFRRAVAEATSLDSGQLELTRATLRQRADDYRPEKMSAVLGSIYDELRAD